MFLFGFSYSSRIECRPYLLLSSQVADKFNRKVYSKHDNKYVSSSLMTPSGRVKKNGQPSKQSMLYNSKFKKLAKQTIVFHAFPQVQLDDGFEFIVDFRLVRLAPSSMQYFG
jgi:hypothetical protein